VTVADFSVQALVAAQLGRECPSDPLVAEEDASALRNAPDILNRVVDLTRLADPGLRAEEVLAWVDRGRGSHGRRFWTLDPIDGTKGLLRGGQYVVALALIEDGVVQVGVLGCPHLSLARDSTLSVDAGARGEGGLAVAVRGRGAWWLPRKDHSLTQLSVSRVSDPTRAQVLHSVEVSHSDVGTLGRLIAALGTDAPPWLMDSQAKHVLIASGAADVLLRFPSQRGFHDAIWDQAAGSLIIEEAGGRVTDLTGRALDFSTGRRLTRNDGLVATNGALHDAVLGAIGHAQFDASSGT